MIVPSPPVVRTEAANRKERIVQCRHIQAQILRHLGSLAGAPARGAGFSKDLRRYDHPAAASRPRAGRRAAAAPIDSVPTKPRTVATES